MALQINDPSLGEANSENQDLQRAIEYHQQGRLDLAEDIYRDILEQQPQNARVYYLLGLIALQLNNLDFAQDFFQDAKDLAPDKSEYLSHLGIVHLLRENYSDSETLFRQALYLSPDNYQALVYLGSLLLLENRYQESIWPLDRAIQINSADPKPFALLAQALTRTDQLEEAEELAWAAINLKPRDQQTMATLTQLLLELNMPWQAINWGQRLLEQQPDNPEFHAKLARAYLGSGIVGRALQEAQRACNLAPQKPEYYVLLSKCQMPVQDWDQALKTINRAQELSPQDERILSQKASVLERKGHYQEAYSLIRPLIAGRTSFIEQPLNILSTVSRKFGAQKEVAELLEEGLKSPGMPRPTRMNLMFNLAELYDDLHLPEQAMNCLQEANTLKGRKYYPEEQLDFFSRLMEVFSSHNMAKIPNSSSESNLPLFIVGMPRSGTSLTEQILASHPEVYGAGELSAVGDITKQISNMVSTKSNYPENILHLNQEGLTKAANMYLERIQSLAPGGVVRITDKMPQNFLHIGFIHLMFPNAPIVHCRRHPLDTCLSCYFLNFLASGLNFSYDLWNLGHYFRLYEQLMRHWKSLLPEQILDLNYEQMVKYPEENISRLLEFCGLEFREECLRFYETKRDMPTASYDQVRQPIYTSSAGRWKRYKDHLQPLIESLGEDILKQYPNSV